MVITASTTRYNEKFVTTLYYNYNPKKKDLYVCLLRKCIDIITPQTNTSKE